MISRTHNSPAKQLRILIVDDYDVVRAGMRTILAGRPNWSVVAEAQDGKAAIARALETQPDVAIIEYYLPFLNGAEVTRQIRAQLPSTEVLIFTVHDDDRVVREILALGARGFVLKSDAITELVQAVAALGEHRTFFAAHLSEAMLRSYIAHPIANPNIDGDMLTYRERAIAQLVAEGHSNKETARLLNISCKTVEARRSSVMRKLKLSSSAELVRYAIRNKLIQP